MAKGTFAKVAAKGKINSCNKKKGCVDLKFGGLNFTGGQFEQLSRWIDDGDLLIITIEQKDGKLPFDGRGKSKDMQEKVETDELEFSQTNEKNKKK